MYGNRSARQVEASKAGLWVMQERRELQAQHEMEFGKCALCRHDVIVNNPRCKDCVCGGGPLKLFEQKERKKIRRR